MSSFFVKFLVFDKRRYPIFDIACDVVFSGVALQTVQLPRTNLEADKGKYPTILRVYVLCLVRYFVVSA